MIIWNCLPYPVNIYAVDDVIRNDEHKKYVLKNKRTKPRLVLSPEGKLLNVRFEKRKIGEIDGIPLYETKLVGVDPIPDEPHYVIVTNLYANAALRIGLRGVGKLLVITDPVYSNPDSSKAVGCLGLVKPW